MAHTFFGFSPEAFEQFIRALALSVFGPGVTAFGNGPDGGREATFLGEVPYPYPPATQWSGYGVIQAKCKEKTESTEKDQQWALKQLSDELKTFVSSDTRHPKPAYYVFVTNVELSSTSGGGRDKADDLVGSYYGKLPLQGHVIWDANQLAAFLDKYAELRRRFSAYLTPGDVLAEMLADINRRRPNTTHILTAFLERELRADAAARLDQAGNRTDDQLRLAQLFFDLPAADEQGLLPPDEKPDAEGKLPPGVLWELLRDGARKLDPKTVYEQEMEQEIGSPKDTSKEFPTRYVLFGGPGSGKSTVSQFLAQIHRAALLSRREPHLLEPHTRQIIDETRAWCDQERSPWPATPRYPFRIELNRLAKSLAANNAEGVESLERYLLKTLQRDNTLTPQDLLEWLGTYPWLLILDGLDEVPATSNRDTLVKAIQDFLAEARQAGADLFVVATSRQQGYGGEFASEAVAFRHILPLSSPRALRYVERYAAARFGQSDPNRAQDLVDKLRQSIKRDLTAPLLSSPLQVTFMATVVAARGDPGEDRWQLFDSYYRTIYDRERQKAVPPYDAVLSKQQSIIDRLHHDIGFWLQYQGETTGGKSVSLPLAQFERLVEAYVSEIGHADLEKAHLVKHITDAARQRLVFLTSRVEGELSFDVRPLQEYMAAECLMAGASEEIVKARLRAIAPAPYWRNVFLFAAGKCFADTRSRHLQDTIRLLCVDLNDPAHPLFAVTLPGAELALDVLQSGAVSENPNYVRHLAKLALSLLAQPYLTDKSTQGVAADQRLALIYGDRLASTYQEELQLRIGQADVDRTLGAWPLLVRLIDREVDWAISLAEQRWPADHQEQLKVVGRLLPELHGVRWLRTKIEELIPEISPPEAGQISSYLPDSSAMPECLRALRQLGQGLRRRQKLISLRISPEAKDNFRVRITPLFLPYHHNCEPYAAPAQMPRCHPGWLPYILADEFVRSPSRQTLSNLLRKCVDGGWQPSHKSGLSIFPWPLSACLEAVQSIQELQLLAEQIDQGVLGDTAEWKAAEERWESQGLTADDLLRRAAGIKPFDSSIACWGSPPTEAELFIKSGNFSNALLQRLCTIAEQLPPGLERSQVMWFLQLASSQTGSIVRCIDPTRLRAACEGLLPTFSWLTNVIGYPEQPEIVDPWIEFFDWLGRSEVLAPNYHPGKFDDLWVETWQRAFISHPTRHGLLRLFGRLAAAGQSLTRILDFLPRPSDFMEPRFQLAAVLVHLTKPDLTKTDANSLADVAAGVLDPLAEPAADELLFRTMESHLYCVPAVEQFLLRLYERLPSDVELGLAKCARLLRQVLRRRASDLQLPDKFQHLQLPVVPVAVSARTY